MGVLRILFVIVLVWVVSQAQDSPVVEDAPQQPPPGARAEDFMQKYVPQVRQDGTFAPDAPPPPPATAPLFPHDEKPPPNPCPRGLDRNDTDLTCPSSPLGNVSEIWIHAPSPPPKESNVDAAFPVPYLEEWFVSMGAPAEVSEELEERLRPTTNNIAFVLGTGNETSDEEGEVAVEERSEVGEMIHARGREGRRVKERRGFGGGADADFLTRYAEWLFWSRIPLAVEKVNGTNCSYDGDCRVRDPVVKRRYLHLLACNVDGRCSFICDAHESEEPRVSSGWCAQRTGGEMTTCAQRSRDETRVCAWAAPPQDLGTWRDPGGRYDKNGYRRGPYDRWVHPDLYPPLPPEPEKKEITPPAWADTDIHRRLELQALSTTSSFPDLPYDWAVCHSPPILWTPRGRVDGSAESYKALQTLRVDECDGKHYQMAYVMGFVFVPPYTARISMRVYTGDRGWLLINDEVMASNDWPLDLNQWTVVDLYTNTIKNLKIGDWNRVFLASATFCGSGGAGLEICPYGCTPQLQGIAQTETHIVA